MSPGTPLSAFPHTPERRTLAGKELFMVTPGDEPGMTLRDYFAARAIGIAHLTIGPNDEGWLGTAKLAYAIADAMLEARQA